MKKGLTILTKALLLATLTPSWSANLAAPSIPSFNENQIHNKKIEQFITNQSTHLTPDFPYRLNLFTQGQIDKNVAGLRIAETAKQLPSSTTGLLFYYELVNNAMRVPHWHSNATEIGTVLEGKMRITIWEGSGEPTVFTVEKNGTWIIPQAKLHALENVGTGQMKFLVSYDSPIAADRDFLTAWASLPDEILARAVGLTENDIKGIKKTTVNRLSAYDPSAGPDKIDESSLLSNDFSSITPLYQSELGSITRIDSSINPQMNKMALQKTILKPGVLRVPHWYTSGDVLLFVLKGNAFFTMMDDDGHVYHAKVERGDLISIPTGNFHSFLNIGQEDLEVYEAFNHAYDIHEITLKNGVEHFSVGMMEGATGLSKELVKKIAHTKPDEYMVAF